MFQRFFTELRAARVPVVVNKVGRTEASAKLARSHSGAIAGSDAAFAALTRMRWQPAIRTLPPYHDDPAYIGALKESVEAELARLDFAPQAIVASFHGMPERTLHLGDPYHCHCQKTARLLSEAVGRELIVAFQSRFGRAKWLEPGTDRVLADYPADGITRIAIAAPGFSADCVETLEELELAAWDGRLARVPGFGPRRLETLRAVLDQRLSRSRRRSARLVSRALAGEPPRPKPARPPVDLLLTVDREYRSRAEAGQLARIAPRRFNPQHTAWLPILHMETPPWSLHALYSNTGQAHHLGRTRDWVVIYYERDGAEGQATVVTEQQGPLAGRRVVRGREEECAERYAAEG